MFGNDCAGVVGLSLRSQIPGRKKNRKRVALPPPSLPYFRFMAVVATPLVLLCKLCMSLMDLAPTADRGRNDPEFFGVKQI